jgi:hypothetical protein
MMHEAWEGPPQTLLVPAGVALRTEEGLALVVVHPLDGKATRMEEGGDLGANEAGRTGYKTVLAHAAVISETTKYTNHTKSEHKTPGGMGILVLTSKRG